MHKTSNEILLSYPIQPDQLHWLDRFLHRNTGPPNIPPFNKNIRGSIIQIRQNIVK